MNRSQARSLFILISIAFIVRGIIIWVTRPEFVGWFNHTYYYFVQTRGLIENGKLPFPEMPLLFYLYSFTAQLLNWCGLELNTAVVNATRFWMCLIPALYPIPIYLIFRSIFKEQSLPGWIWFFLFASAFYPFSILNMTEFLQKNILGIFLLCILMYQSFIAIEKQTIKQLSVVVFIFLLIVFTHFGTTAVTLLYLASFVFSYYYHSKASILKPVLSLIIGLSLSLLVFYLFDIQRFERIGDYLNRVFDSSALSSLFSSNMSEIITSLFIMIIPLGFTIFLYRCFRNAREMLDRQNSVFWLTNIIFCYLLVLPIYDSTLIARFILYLSLPLIFVLVYMVQNVVLKHWMKKLLLGAVIIGVLGIAFGSIGTLFFLNKDKKEIHMDLITLKKAIDFKDDDLILARHGAEHISNWFLETKASLITSFNDNDFKKYNRIFILNPKNDNTSLASDKDEASKKYYYMTINIPEPKEASLIYESDYIRLLELKNVPAQWEFDSNGNWIRYK